MADLTRGLAHRRDVAAARYRAAIADIPEILELVADACAAPMVALKVTDDAGAHFAATLGITAPVDVPRSKSLCDMVSVSDDIIIFDDAARDPRVAAHPLVAGSAHVRFLAVAPLHYHQQIAGALCVFDTARRTSDAARTRRLLTNLARRIDRETALRDQVAAQEMLTGMVGCDEIVTAISHEIRTPLAAIQGNLELLTGLPDAVAPRYRGRVDAINRNADRLRNTVDNLLRTVLHQRDEPTGAPDSVDLAALAASVVSGLGPAAARVVLDRPGHPVPAVADPRLLASAVGQLIGNALAHSPADQPVHVVVSACPQPSIQVRDRGPGLTPAELERVGAPFFRGDVARRQETPGLGLGLTISRRIVEAQGGALRLDSVWGEGFTAEVVLPLPVRVA